MAVRFNIQKADEHAVARLEREFGAPRFIATTLAARGIDTPQAARDFLSPSLDRDWRDPYEIPGLREVVDALEAAIRNGKRICVFGDFDVDGVSATTTLTRAIRTLGGDAHPFIPYRNEEGYGITEAAIERLMSTISPQLVVTVDCGIACKRETKLLQERGVDVCITDHHEAADLVPEGIPVCDPKMGEGCESSILAGVGVALKVVQVLGGRFGTPYLWTEYTDFATLGTVADLMPMMGENRALVADGVVRMNRKPRPCIAALLDVCGASKRLVEASNLSFSIIPRLNAAGRMGDATLALKLLLSDDFDEACLLAAELESVNDQRRAVEAELAEMAMMQASEVYHGQRALVVAGEGWHEGVKGIVAGRLVRTYGVPTILFTIDEDGTARGSGRSVGQVNLFKAVESCSDMLVRFGGHAAAVGVTIEADKLPQFSDALCAYMDNLPAESFHPRMDIDAVVDLAELTLPNIEKLQKLAPFGQQNPQPLYLARNVTLANCRAVGANKNHFSCSLSTGSSSVSGIMFNCNDISSFMHCDSVVDAAFEVQIDEWRGRRSVKAMLRSIVPAHPCAALEACMDPETLALLDGLYAATDSELCADVQTSPEEFDEVERERTESREQWSARAKQDPLSVRAALVEAFVGEGGSLNDTQREALDLLAQGESVLAIMATGRGKSLIFQVYAARRALERGTASIFVYPLRALIADQAFHIQKVLDTFGVTARVLTGESSVSDRVDVFMRLESGAVDIVLTTPEFLQAHTEEFARSGRVGFVVVDEAHHIGQAKAGNRPAYANFAQTLATLGSPQMLALTATADCATAQDIERACNITHTVCDPSVRENLELDDRRNLKKRESFLASLVADGRKTIVYVSSRQQSVSLARSLRKRLPQMASLIGFYNAGLARAERTHIEELFRKGTLSVLVATSAFGEGVNIPDVRHVVLYNLPFNEIELNQMSGRAGRDGKPATIHVLFNAHDSEVNDRFLRISTPDRDGMACAYRYLRACQKESGCDPFDVADADIARFVAQTSGQTMFTNESAACSIAVFRELGLVKTAPVDQTQIGCRRVLVPNATSKVELADSVRYREGTDEIAVFHEFRTWAMNVDAARLRERLIRPIMPHNTENNE